MRRLIKKYKNRRLYDTEKSKYITIEDLKKYVLENIEFTVQDAASKEDLTNTTLQQILFEIGSDKTASFFSSQLLRQFICMANHQMSKSLQSLLENILTAVEKTVDENSYQKHIEKATEDWNKKIDDLSQYWKKFFNKES